MKRFLRRQEIELFGLSFVDLLCCAFGAVTFLFMNTDMEMTAAQKRHQQQIAQAQQEQDALEGKLAASEDARDHAQHRVGQLEGDILAGMGLVDWLNGQLVIAVILQEENYLIPVNIG